MAAPAVKAHVKHGDPLPGDTIAADGQFPYGAVWSADCIQVPNPPPDSDGDGVADDVDACLNQGDQGNGGGSDGCPLPPPTLEEVCGTDPREIFAEDGEGAAAGLLGGVQVIVLLCDTCVNEFQTSS